MQAKITELWLEIFYKRSNIEIKKAERSPVEIMKFEEVMEFLSVGKNTLYALLNSGEIQAFRIGKVWKIPRKSVTAYVEGKLAGKD